MSMILLASRSPQRRGLLRSIGVEHRVVASGYPEDDLPGLRPHDVVLEHARAKARDVAARSGIPAGGAVLGADTAVVIDDEVLGKPEGRAHADHMLSRLSGVTHTVLTAICLVDAAGEESVVDAADVTFRTLTAAHREWYLDRGEWQGRAGGYAIQGSGAGFVRAIQGDQTTIIGLPVATLIDLLERRGLAPWRLSG